ncbi:hypothetical protein [Halomicrococcus sp. NG-SE-24]|uniref:hypothetical protein n=1 Tax=Halomicrococcus sp. NG-SE-24 TaxID=3436928 RepID=UPI003D96ADF1
MATMNATTLFGIVLSGVNVLLLLALTLVWLRNYRTFRTPLAFGLLAFGGVLLVENALAIYFFFSMRMLFSPDPTVQTVVAVLRGLQFVALGLLTYVTMK